MNTRVRAQGGRDQDFITYLRRLVDEKDMEGRTGSEARATLAALRRGLGKEPGEAAEMYRYVAPWTQGMTLARENAYYLVAALFAAHAISWPATGDESRPFYTNLGASLAYLATETGSDSVEKRFTALLNCDREDLPSHLRRIVMLLKGHDIAIDWLRLLYDVLNWNQDSRRVQREWARAFWGYADTTPGNPQSSRAEPATSSPAS